MASPKGLKRTIAEAMNAIEARQGARALASATAALKLAPSDPEANFVMGMVQEGRGRLAQAERHYRACLAENRDHVRALIRLGLIAITARNGDSAIACLERAVAIAPASATARHYLARAYGLALRFEEAAAAFALAHRQQPRDPEILAGYARASALVGRSEEALEIYRRLEKERPQDDAVQQGIATALIRTGRAQEAEPHLRNAIRLKPDRGTPYLQLARSGRLGPEDSEAARRFAAAPSLAPEERSVFLLALGTQAEHDGQAEESFAAISRANSLRRASRSYDRASVVSLADRILAALPETMPAPMESAGPVPLLIMGMPRSGTTLVEQMLSRHPKVAALGERTTMDEYREQLARDGLVYPEGLSALGGARCEDLRARYVAGAPPGSATHITDKLPDNVFNLPLIRRLFPEARILVCRRHPLDIAWSIFKQGFGRQVPYATDLRDIAHHMRQQDRILTRWLAADPRQSREVLYEELVARFPVTARAIVEFAGLGWNEACLSFQESTRTVLTASAAQVRRGIDASSIGRWRAIAGHLAAIREELADLIQAHDEKLASRGLSSGVQP